MKINEFSKMEVTKDGPKNLPPYIFLEARNPDSAIVQIGNQYDVSYLSLNAIGKSSFQVSATEYGCNVRIGVVRAAGYAGNSN